MSSTPNFGKSERDFDGHRRAECSLTPDMASFAGKLKVDYDDSWWMGDRVVAYV